jgi:DNA-binding LacI/PurR family transcriptional regulator
VSLNRARGAAPAHKAPTIFDVAARAGVSKSTVSNVIRGAPSVAPELRAQVLEAVEALGYRPNNLARQLALARSTTIGVVVGGFRNQFFFEMAVALERAASRRGYGVMLCNSEGDADRELEGIERLLEHRVAGILMATSGAADRAQKVLHKRCPVVFICDGTDWCDLVSVEDRAGTLLATEHLVALGHRRLLYLSSPLVEPVTARARKEGFKAGATKVAQVALTACLEEGRVRTRTNYADLGALIRHWRITGVVCVNDSTALEVLDHLERDGLAVPEDVSVVGFDDIPTASLSRISLTTVAQPIADLAEDAVKLLCGRIEGSLKGKPRVLRHKVSLVERGTTAAPRGHHSA